jgi:hypothetical protein
LDAFAVRSDDAKRKGAQAFARLVQLAETRDSGQISRVVRFLAATCDSEAFQLDLFELRAVYIAIGGDMLSCPDALRWGRADLYTLIADGDVRLRARLERCGLR